MRLSALLFATLFLGASSLSALDAHAQAKAPKAAAEGGEKKAAEKKGGEKKGADAASAPKAEESKGAASKGTVAPAKAGGPEVVEVEEKGEKGVKTYKFGPVEVEGRLKSPQILYFLRRVRAEFEAGLLGHRSFMRELSDTRRHPAFK